MMRLTVSLYWEGYFRIQEAAQRKETTYNGNKIIVAPLIDNLYPTEMYLWMIFSTIIILILKINTGKKKCTF